MVVVIVQSLSCVQLFAPPWTAAHQACLFLLSPGACSNSCPLSRWCHPTISSSVTPFSSCLQSFPGSGSFPTSWLFTSGGQSIGASASASVLPKNIQGWFPLGLIGLISLLSNGLSRVFSISTVWDHQVFCTQPSLWPNLTSIHDYWKNIALIIQTFVSKVMSLLFNILSRFAMDFLEQESFNFMAAVTIHSNFGSQKNKSVIVSMFPHLFAMKWWDEMSWS